MNKLFNTQNLGGKYSRVSILFFSTFLQGYLYKSLDTVETLKEEVKVQMTTPFLLSLKAVPLASSPCWLM
jgi:hypothetical protein